MRRMILPLLFGVVGAAVLVSLGVWQLHRLEWKLGVIERVEARLAAAPVELPAAPDAERDAYLPVRVRGRFTGEELTVLTSVPGLGPGYRHVSVLVTGAGRRIMVDRGFAPEAAPVTPPAGAALVTGNLHWPDEADSFTPEPDVERGLFFARDVAAMAEFLASEPVLVVARRIEPADPVVRPMPLDAAAIRNDHLGYAITWFLLAAAWVGMTGLWLWRIRPRQG